MLQRLVKSRRFINSLTGCLLIGAAIFTFGALQNELKAQQLAKMDWSTQTPAIGLQGHSLSHFTAIANEALAQKPTDYEAASLASVNILQIDPENIAAWNRLAFIDQRQNGQLTQEGIAALYKSYTLSPFGDLDMMIWRTDFASANWSSLPTGLKTSTLAQVPVIGRFGTSWEWRIQNCKYNPHKDLYEAVCKIAPGVNRPHQ